MATATTNILLRYNYPKVPGDQPWSITDIHGPTSYTTVTSGTPPSGGQRITAADFGMGSFDFVVAMASNNGAMSVTVIPEGFALGGSFEAVLLKWMTASGEVATGTNISSSTVRLMAIGRF